ncbi:MAG: hypothetical protein QG635_1713, partial [Bacteroidota bacterium]|nr:hypothetical protein [Bacteroidota bacterium]
MKTLFLISALICSAFTFSLYSQTITTKPLTQSQYCGGSEMEIGYDSTGAFTSNVFAQLSTDNFITFENYSQIAGKSAPGMLTILIPETIAKGTKYRIRVCNANPYIMGSDNGSDFAIWLKPKGVLNINTFYNKCFYGLNEKIQFSSSLPDITDYQYFPTWIFGAASNPRYFFGYTPPEVQYDTAGYKTVYYEIFSKQVCPFYQNTTKQILIYDCKIKIDSAAYVDTLEKSLRNIPIKSDFSQIWVMPNAKLTGNYFYYLKPLIIIIETLGIAEFESDVSSVLFYVKPGGILKLNGSSHQNAILKAPGASITVLDSIGNRIIECPDMKFDYSDAPEKGVKILEDLGYISVKDEEKTENNSEFSISPNPASDFIN